MIRVDVFGFVEKWRRWSESLSSLKKRWKERKARQYMYGKRESVRWCVTSFVQGFRSSTVRSIVQVIAKVIKMYEKMDDVV